MDYRIGLGLGIMALAFFAFVVHLVQVLRGSKTPGTLIYEAIHDLGLFLLGLSGLFVANQPVRDGLFWAAIVTLVVYLVYRYGWRGRSINKSGENRVKS